MALLMASPLSWFFLLGEESVRDFGLFSLLSASFFLGFAWRRWKGGGLQSAVVLSDHTFDLRKLARAFLNAHLDLMCRMLCVSV